MKIRIKAKDEMPIKEKIAKEIEAKPEEIEDGYSNVLVYFATEDLLTKDELKSIAEAFGEDELLKKELKPGWMSKEKWEAYAGHAIGNYLLDWERLVEEAFDNGKTLKLKAKAKDAKIDLNEESSNIVRAAIVHIRKAMENLNEFGESDISEKLASALAELYEKYNLR